MQSHGSVVKKYKQMSPNPFTLHASYTHALRMSRVLCRIRVLKQSTAPVLHWHADDWVHGGAQTDAKLISLNECMSVVDQLAACQ